MWVGASLVLPSASRWVIGTAPSAARSGSRAAASGRGGGPWNGRARPLQSACRAPAGCRPGPAPGAASRSSRCAARRCRCEIADHVQHQLGEQGPAVGVEHLVQGAGDPVVVHGRGGSRCGGAVGESSHWTLRLRHPTNAANRIPDIVHPWNGGRPIKQHVPFSGR